MKKTNIDHFFSILQSLNEKPQTELEFVNDFTLLVAVVLSAQATDKGVNKATKSLFANIQTPEAMVNLGEEDLKNYIKTIGLYNSKAKNVIALSKALIEKHNSQIPDTRPELEALPGVGRKTANVVLNQAFGQPTIAVDTHIFRVSNRTGLAKGKTPLEVEKKLEKKIPEEWKYYSHHWLILLGRYTCQARKPKCHECPVYEVCGYNKKSEYANF